MVSWGLNNEPPDASLVVSIQLSVTHYAGPVQRS